MAYDTWWNNTTFTKCYGLLVFDLMSWSLFLSSFDISSMSVAYPTTESTPPCLMLSLIGISLVRPYLVWILVVRLLLSFLMMFRFLPSTPFFLRTYKIASSQALSYAFCTSRNTTYAVCFLLDISFTVCLRRSDGPRLNCPIFRQLGHSWWPHAPWPFRWWFSHTVSPYCLLGLFLFRLSIFCFYLFLYTAELFLPVTRWEYYFCNVYPIKGFQEGVAYRFVYFYDYFVRDFVGSWAFLPLKFLHDFVYFFFTCWFSLFRCFPFMFFYFTSKGSLRLLVLFFFYDFFLWTFCSTCFFKPFLAVCFFHPGLCYCGWFRFWCFICSNLLFADSLFK